MTIRARLGAIKDRHQPSSDDRRYCGGCEHSWPCADAADAAAALEFLDLAVRQYGNGNPDSDDLRPYASVLDANADV